MGGPYLHADGLVNLARLRHRLAIGAVLTALTIVAAPALGHPGHGPSEVEVGDDFFRSNDVRAVTGDTVMWTWLGPAGEHSVSSDPGRAESFDSDRPVIRSASVRPARVCAESAP